ncbi:MAG TPA: sulfite exporter TauE/SafE family protein, partial [Bryobacteraceae bacterium]|nr:sulfite exporter TauE/SafE family protein [Bryobacteraceae bacterium]
AGGINSVAGGGTLVTFPTLMWLGLPSVTANATNTVAIWPGSLGSIWGFRRELGRTDPVMRWLVIPSFLGGAAGALLLRSTPPGVFDRLVPFLILFATVLFTVQAPIQRWLKRGLAHEHSHRTPGWFAGVLFFQFLVGTYGGYFGAGMGIMMLSALSIFGMTDILEMNALTSLFGLCINGIAAVLFIASGMIYWPYVLVMAIAAITGGYAAAGVARKIGKTAVRRFVIAIGYTIATILFIRMLRG